MKGPAATTLYGTEAANGVIQIITKKGAIGKTTWDFSTRQGANWFDNPQGRLWTNFDINAAGDTVSKNYTQLEKNLADSTGEPIFTTGYRQGYNLGLGGGIAAAPLSHLGRLREEQWRRESLEQRQHLHGAREPRRVPQRQARHLGERGLHGQQDESGRGSRLRRHDMDDVLHGSREHRHATAWDSSPACRRRTTNSISSSRRSTASPAAWR